MPVGVAVPGLRRALVALLALVSGVAARKSRSSELKVQLVICRLASESVTWALDAFPSGGGTSVQVVVMNGGQPLGLPDGTEYRLSGQGGHETACYLDHIQRVQSASPAAITVFSPARPRCGAATDSLSPVAPQLTPSVACTSRLMRAVRDLAKGRATIEPHGYAPIEPSPLAGFWVGLPRTLLCLPRQYADLSSNRDMQADSDFITYSPSGAFAVDRRNLDSAPQGWLRRAHQALLNSTVPPNGIRRCCKEGRTCVPFLMERLWPMLLGTPHRGCGSGVRTGYCASEWKANLAAAAKGKGTAASTTPDEGSGAIKLRMDISRVARLARFTTALDEDERAALFELPTRVKEMAKQRKDSSSGGSRSCTTQRCAILSLLGRAGEGDDSDLALYLSVSTTNSSDAMVAPDRAQKRCRDLFLNPTMLLNSVQRVQPKAAPAASEGVALHSALQKVYGACLRQMAMDSRWYTRPYIYGFGRDSPIANDYGTKSATG